MTDLVWKNMGVHADTGNEKNNFGENNYTYGKGKAGGDVMNAKALAGVAQTNSRAFANPTQATATAGACGPNAKASAALVEGVIEASANAVLGKAEATAGVGLEHLGAYAKAEAVTARVEAGVKHTPLKVHAQGPATAAETGFSWDYAGANVGASLGEARAGPFAARAGVKFGAGVRNGVPEVDLGPVSVPCSIM